MDVKEDKMNKNLILVLVLVVLVVVSVVETVQLVGLKSKLETSSLKLGSSKSPTQITTTSQSSSLDELPSMVGGC